MQISDLHLSSKSISNDALISSLLSDMDKYGQEDPEIRKPELVIICGDIIEGVKSADTINSASKELDEQYNIAIDFLERLTDKLFCGDNNKVVIIPGNHDISWTHSKFSMEKLGIKNKNLRDVSKNPLSNIRWSWDDHSYYKINDHKTYLERLRSFSEFYLKFYETKRKYELKEENQYDYYEYPEYKIIIVGFNTCYRNDHLNSLSRIHPKCMSLCHEVISDEKYDNWKKIALWHHGVYGFPQRTDFIDEGTIQFLIDKGFSIGLHGHLHKNEIYKITLSKDQKLRMHVFGVGSFSSFQNTLPPGERHQYNLLEFNENAIVIHNRKAIELPIGLPIWMRGNIVQNMNKSYLSVEITKDEKAMKQDIEPIKILSEVDRLISERAYHLALQKLGDLNPDTPFVRKLTIECLVQSELPERLISFIGKPQNVPEFAYLTEALWLRNKKTNIIQLLIEYRNDINYAKSEAYKRMKKLTGYGEE